MFGRPSLRAAVTTVAAAGVLVAGADLVSYAATGNPLILGHSNSAGGTTALRNTGRGPALSLNNIKSAPPLVVNSSKVVKHLDADKLDGLSANQVNPAVVEYRLGSSGTISNDDHFFIVPAPAGDQRFTMTGIWTSTQSADSIECLVFDKRYLNDTTNLHYIFAAFNKSESDPDANFIQQGNYVHFTKHQKLLLGCSTSGDTGTVSTAGGPIVFAFHKVHANVKHGTPFAPKSSIRNRTFLR
jgi:hypothetical protein